MQALEKECLHFINKHSLAQVNQQGSFYHHNKDKKNLYQKIFSHNE